MRETEQADFVKVLNGMASMKRVALTMPAIDLWWMCMKDWELSHFEAVAAELMRTHKWMPDPSDFDAFLKKADITAGEAWALVLDYVRHGRYEKQPSIGDSRIDAVVRMLGGWRAIAMSDSDKTHFLEKRFAEHYTTHGEVLAAREAQLGLAAPGLALPRAKPALLR